MKMSAMLGVAFSKLQAAAGRFLHNTDIGKSQWRSSVLVAGAYLGAQRRMGWAPGWALSDVKKARKHQQRNLH